MVIEYIHIERMISAPVCFAIRAAILPASFFVQRPDATSLRSRMMTPQKFTLAFILFSYMKSRPAASMMAQQGGSLLKFDFEIFACIPDTTSPGQGRNGNRAWLRVTGISPLRGSLRAAPIACGCGWTGVPTLVLSSQDRSATACFLDERTR